MLFSIITPTRNNLPLLKLCAASVADQTGVQAEHIVQDAGSTDGTAEWLLSQPHIRAFVEHDQGMYDALNRGIGHSAGDVIGHLNGDEQYLPHALRGVAQFLAAHPEADIVAADTLIVDSAGSLLCFRKVVRPSAWHVMVSHLPTFTCSIFCRRRFIDTSGIKFRCDKRAIADAYWLLDALRLGARIGILRIFTYAYTETGMNLRISADAHREKRDLRLGAPGWVRLLSPVFIAWHRMRKLLSGCYFQPAFSYSIYTQAQPGHRMEFRVARPSFRWPTFNS